MFLSQFFLEGQLELLSQFVLEEQLEVLTVKSVTDIAVERSHAPFLYLAASSALIVEQSLFPFLVPTCSSGYLSDYLCSPVPF